ncbi:hypothetical protein ACUR5C_00325 [Aliikangiella sp. IMCC44653]
MKILIIILSIFSFSVFAEEECVFDSDEQKKFNKAYIASHKDSVASDEGDSIIITRANEIIKFSRGGCVHFGIFIESTIKGKKTLSEEEFFSKVAGYTKEFGGELVDANDLLKAIKAKKYSKQTTSGNLYYFVGVESVQAFEISVKSNRGETHVDVGFYIN